MGDQGHVAGALAQRRQGDRNDMKAIIEVLAEAAGPHLGHRVAIGGADEAHIHRLQLGAADPREGAGLDEAKQLRLQPRVHLADFVEEERAAVGAPGGSLAVGD